MKSMVLRAFSFLLSLFAISSALQAADTNPPPRLTVELRDGSRVVGESMEKYFKFHSALLGEIKLPVKDVRSIECNTTNLAKLATVNNDSLSVTMIEAEIPLKTSFGQVELATHSIHKLTVSPGLTGGQRAGLVGCWPMIAGSSTLTVPHSEDLVSMQQTRELTFEAWIKPNSIPREFPVILSKGGNQRSGAYGGYEFCLNANGDNDLGFLSGATSVWTMNANGQWINQHLGEWIHVAFTLDDKTKTANFYVNGKPTRDDQWNGIGSTINFDVPNALYIGMPDPASHPNRARFDGEIRNVMLFNRALSAEEILADYSTGHPD